MSPEVIANLDAIKVNMNEAGMNAINIVLAFVMFGVALGIKPKTFVDIVKKPQSVILGIICQMILLPAFTYNHFQELAFSDDCPRHDPGGVMSGRKHF